MADLMYHEVVWMVEAGGLVHKAGRAGRPPIIDPKVKQEKRTQ